MKIVVTAGSGFMGSHIVPCRDDDETSVYSNTDKANAVLGWKTQSALEVAIASVWIWEQKLRLT